MTVASRVGRRDTHAKIEPSAAGQGARDVRGNRQVADYYLGAHRAQRAGTFIFAVNQRAHRQISPAQALYHCASDSAYAAAGAGDKDGALNHYAESLL